MPNAAAIQARRSVVSPAHCVIGHCVIHWSLCHSLVIVSFIGHCVIHWSLRHSLVIASFIGHCVIHWFLFIVHWALVIGHWFLVIGLWSLLFFFFQVFGFRVGDQFLAKLVQLHLHDPELWRQRG